MVDENEHLKQEVRSLVFEQMKDTSKLEPIYQKPLI
jgi:hypothetical protein